MGRYDPRHMSEVIDNAFRRSVLFRPLKPEDRQRLAAVATVRAYEKGVVLFNEGDDSTSDTSPRPRKVSRPRSGTD
jgi:hypothetical protein